MLAASAGAAELASPIGSGAEPAAPWRVVGLPKQTKPFTRFSVAELDDKRVLKVEADRAYGNLVHELKDARPGMLSWRWRVDQAPVGSDLHRKSGDDSPLKVCALFEMPAQRVPFFERQLLRLAELRSGENLPSATLCYVWDEHLPQGTLVRNAFTHRVRSIVTHGTIGRWREERHDIAADFQRAFGDEWPDTQTTPPLVGVAVGADSDNTGSRSVGFVSDLQLSAERR